MAKVRFTDADVQKLDVKAEAYLHGDPLLSGHFVRVLPSGTKSFVVVARNGEGKQQWRSVGRFQPLGSIKESTEIEKARERAREAIEAIRKGHEPPSVEPYRKVADDWLKRHVKAKGLRAGVEYRRYLDKHVLPVWGSREFKSIRRHDVAKLLDQIEDKAGPVAADNVLKVIRSIANWYAARHEDYSSPIITGMRRSNPGERARDRILNDDELRAVWRVAESNGAFGALVRLLLLTAQRREKVVAMRWDEISIDGVWSIPSEKREKGNGGELKLPPTAVEIVKSRTRMGSNPYVFAAARGTSHMTGFAKMKMGFDAKLPEVAPWRLHDLRRTARSLMSRAGVRPDIGERVLGHAIGGVAGVYDRHTYDEQKADALLKLADLIQRIVAEDGESPQCSKQQQALNL